MTIYLWQWLFVIVSFGSMLITLACQFTLRFTLDKRIRKRLPPDKVYDSFYDGYFGIWRALLFANASISNSKRFKRAISIFYDDVEVTKYATQFDRFVACTHWIFGTIFLICIPIFFITEWLGIFEWPDS